MKKKFWNWKANNSEDVTEERILELYGTIAEESWFDDDITPAMFKKELFSGEGPITIWINSPGGDCIAASQIYGMLMDYPGEVTVKIDGLAASAASVIVMAGTKVLMVPTALMMIHNPATAAFGDHGEMERAIDMLEEVKESIINAYEIRTSLPRKQLARMMEDETWMNAKKAIELGFADDLLTDSKREAPEDLESYSFAASAVDRALVAKMKEKMKTQKEDAPVGRSVDDLRASLYKKLL